jgi:hypothetical protein
MNKLTLLLLILSLLAISVSTFITVFGALEYRTTRDFADRFVLKVCVVTNSTLYVKSPSHCSVVSKVHVAPYNGSDAYITQEHSRIYDCERSLYYLNEGGRFRGCFNYDTVLLWSRPPVDSSSLVCGVVGLGVSLLLLNYSLWMIVAYKLAEERNEDEERHLLNVEPVFSS